MYCLKKTMEVSAGHQLDLPYPSKCTNYHGHNWDIIVEIHGDTLINGMLMDFATIKKLIFEPLDHSNLCNVISASPTAETIAHWCYMQLEPELETMNPSANIAAITVIESKGNEICYIP